MRVTAFIAVLLIAAAGGVAAQQGPAQFSPEWYQQFRGPYSAPVEPFRIVGNIHYVGGANIASYLITTPLGHILIDTGMKEMHDGHQEQRRQARFSRPPTSRSCSPATRISITSKVTR
jgi:hypothetical protein